MSPTLKVVFLDGRVEVVVSVDPKREGKNIDAEQHKKCPVSLVVVPLVLDRPAQLLDEVLVVGDDDELEVAVGGALLHDLGQGHGEGLDVVSVLERTVEIVITFHLANTLGG